MIPFMNNLNENGLITSIDLVYKAFTLKFQFKIREKRFLDNFETIFQLKVSISEKLKEVDHCENYEKGEYESCLLKDIQEKFMSILNCIPPWFSVSYDEKVPTNLVLLMFKVFCFT